MSDEIKVVYAEVEKELAELRTAIIAVQTSIASSIQACQDMITAEKVNKLNESLQQILKRYQKILLNNESMANKAIQKLREVDETLAAGMRKR
ncbi:YwqI/YxiC family protein [Bacillus aquiflavi]|uniref:YwqI/YxiC family protein n=1 Tax=Bacillus aquiflavi TaxID=2672567 RepID=A0A6B3W0Y4_9BACI|nr:YwqI/YxiC family protein [Bacillus aquiflavi]MBA4538803.1 YwqI/YxiC family protein [Bacillus aquiflavi]NEY83158.1 YwqI/YxiC family protein [Bacillus aquiflavi]UAC48402.1 YwqI/YxiC family protein [Bacillus aquiflavi]